MFSDKKEKDKKKEDETRRYDKEYPENGDNYAAGAPDSGALPNKPAENEERTSPEEDEKDTSSS